MTIETTHRDSVAAKLQEIPAEKLSTMIARTAWGFAFIAFGLAMGLGWVFAGVPVLIAFGTAVFGAIMASGQLTAHPFKLFIAFLRDLIAAWREKSAAPPQ